MQLHNLKKKYCMHKISLTDNSEYVDHLLEKCTTGLFYYKTLSHSLSSILFEKSLLLYYIRFFLKRIKNT